MLVGGKPGEEEHASLLPRVGNKGSPESLDPPALNRDTGTQVCSGLCSPMLLELSQHPERGLGSPGGTYHLDVASSLSSCVTFLLAAVAEQFLH